MSERHHVKPTRRLICSGALAAVVSGQLDGVVDALPVQAPISSVAPRVSWTEVVASLPGDSRRYSFATFANGARAIIVSDAARNATQLAMRVNGGSLDDPYEFEGLAHLSEHVTLREIYGDRDFEGRSYTYVNGYTARRTTNFEISLDFDEDDLPENDLTKATHELSQASEAFVAGFKRVFSSDLASGPSLAVVRKEVLRVNEEKALNPGKALLEVTSLKSRASPFSSWHRLGQGDSKTLPVKTDVDALKLARALARFRKKYFESPSTIVVFTPIALEDATRVIGNAFNKLPQLKQGTTEKQDTARLTQSQLGSKPNLQQRFKGIWSAFAIEHEQAYSTLSLVWEVDFEACSLDALTERLRNPLEIIGKVLTYPHSQSLASLLRRRRLSPLYIEKEEIVQCQVIDKADSWALFKMEIVIAKGSESRWPEAISLAVAAVSRLADDGVPPSLVEEIQQMTRATDTWFPKQIKTCDATADIGACDMEPSYFKLMSGSTNLASPSFEGDIDTLREVSNLVAKNVAKETPLITVWTPNVDLFDIDEHAQILDLPLEGLTPLVPLLVPLAKQEWKPFFLSRRSDSCTSDKACQQKQFSPQSRNPWVPSNFRRADDLMEKQFRTFPNAGLEIVQLCGLIDPDEMACLTGGAGISPASPLRRAFSKTADWPFAVAILQLESPVVDKYLQGKPESLGLWRLTMLQALSEKTEAAALWSNMNFDIFFNKAGMQIFASGYAERLPNFMAVLLESALRESPTMAGSFELEVARQVLQRKLQLRSPPLQNESTKAISSDMTKFFKSVTNSSLLLAGNIAKNAADSLAFNISGQLQALPKSSEAHTPASMLSDDFRSGMRRWRELLVEPPIVWLRTLDVLIKKSDQLK